MISRVGWMGGPPDEFVQGSEICDEADALAVGLGYKESRATPCGGFVNRCDNLAINEFRDCLLGLWFSVLGLS